MILPIDSMLIRGFPDTAESNVPGNPAAWLKEFEAAQWRQHYWRNPASPTADKTARNDGGEPRAARPGAGADAGGQDAASLPATPAARNAALPEQAPHHAAPVLTGDFADAPAPWHGQAWFWPPLQDRAQPPAGFGPPAAQALRSPVRPAAVPWQASHIHAMADGTAVSVWLRDARIDPDRARDMLYELSRRFARSGLRLALFTLNGKPVTAPASNLRRTP